MRRIPHSRSHPAVSKTKNRRDISPNVIHEGNGEKNARFYRPGRGKKHPVFSHVTSFNDNEKIGSGAYGTVYRATDESVVKKLKYYVDIPPQSISELPRDVLHEHKMFQRLYSDPCSLSYEFHEDNNHLDVYLEMPKVPGMPLDNFINSESPLSDQLLIAEAAIIAMRDFHEKMKGAHCDIKPTNMMCDFEEAFFRYVVRFIDLGSFKNTKKGKGFREGPTTLAYSSPGTYSGKEENLFLLDSISLGFTLLEIFRAKDIFKFRCFVEKSFHKKTLIKIERYKQRYPSDKKGLKKLKTKRKEKLRVTLSKTIINYNGLLDDALNYPELKSYIDTLKESLMKLTDIGSQERKPDLSQVQINIGNAFGAFIASSLIQIIEDLENNPLGFHENNSKIQRLLNIFYSNPDVNNIETIYYGRKEGANRFLHEYGEGCRQFEIANLNFFEEEATRKAFKNLEILSIKKAINFLIEGALTLEEQKLLLSEICSGDKDYLISQFPEETAVLREKIVGLYRKSNISEDLFSKFLEFTFISDDKNFYKSLQGALKRLSSKSTYEPLKGVLKKLIKQLKKRHHDGVDSDFSSNEIYKIIKKTFKYNKRNFNVFSKFQKLLLNLGDRPSEEFFILLLNEFCKKHASVAQSNNPQGLFPPATIVTVTSTPTTTTTTVTPVEGCNL